MFVVRFFPLAGFQEVSEWGVVHAHLLFEREREREMMVLSVNATQNVTHSRARDEYHLEMMMIAFSNLSTRYENKEHAIVLRTSDFNSGSGFSVVAAAADDTDADADDAASDAALVFVVVVVFSAVSASAATLTALTLLDFCFNDVDVLFVPPLLFDDDAVA